MGEERNGTPNGDMPPQEDAAKMPLTDGNEPKIEVKEASNGDAKIAIASDPEEFKGLTKEELMQYAKDPFWVRLRIFLMFLFWACWVVMLALAIYIIVVAPRCEPPPTITWLQESPMLQVDVSTTDSEEVTSLMERLGLTSLYIPDLISDMDFANVNMTYVKEHVVEMLMAASGASIMAVTDIVPSPVRSNHPWVANSSLVDSGTLELNFGDPLMDAALQGVYRNWKTTYNVTGFLVSQNKLETNSDLHNLTLSLNDHLEGDQIAIGESAVDMSDVIDHLNTPGVFKQFLLDNDEEWSYYKFNPVSGPHRTASPEQMPAVTLSLMLLPATPILQVSTQNLTEFEMTVGPLVLECIKLRQKDAIKFGETQFANTTDNVVAFTRTLKGTPGYAVAVNLGNEEGSVDFRGLEFVPEEGTVAYSYESQLEHSLKMDLGNVEVGPHAAMVLQFVAKY